MTTNIDEFDVINIELEAPVITNLKWKFYTRMNFHGTGSSPDDTWNMEKTTKWFIMSKHRMMRYFKIKFRRQFVLWRKFYRNSPNAEKAIKDFQFIFDSMGAQFNQNSIRICDFQFLANGKS